VFSWSSNPFLLMVKIESSMCAITAPKFVCSGTEISTFTSFLRLYQSSKSRIPGRTPQGKSYFSHYYPNWLETSSWFMLIRWWSAGTAVKIVWQIHWSWNISFDKYPLVRCIYWKFVPVCLYPKGDITKNYQLRRWAEVPTGNVCMKTDFGDCWF